MKELLVLNPETASEEEIRAYPVREAARAIVIDSGGKIALLHVTNHAYYKLPGGGLEGDEDKIVALGRECQEEIGCDVDVIGEIGMIVEYRKLFTLKQVSYCYLSHVKGEKGTSNFTELEISGGFECVWVTYDEAIRLMEESAKTANNLEGKSYIVPRDTMFLNTAKDLL